MAGKLYAYAIPYLHKYGYTKDPRALSTAKLLMQRVEDLAPEMTGLMSDVKKSLSACSQPVENPRERYILFFVRDILPC